MNFPTFSRSDSFSSLIKLSYLEEAIEDRDMDDERISLFVERMLFWSAFPSCIVEIEHFWKTSTFKEIKKNKWNLINVSDFNDECGKELLEDRLADVISVEQIQQQTTHANFGEMCLHWLKMKLIKMHEKKGYNLSFKC